MIALYMLAGAGFYLFAWQIIRNRFSALSVGLLFVIGLLLRLGFFNTPAILEIDFNRYFWDGAMTAHGLDPYQYSPQEIMDFKVEDDAVPKELLSLRQEGAETLSRINFPEIRTIYTPLVQMAFAAAYRLQPYRLWSWRLILLLVDLLNFYLLLKILLKNGRPKEWAGIYWLNPLVIKEIFNSGHMDILIFPFLLGAILFALHSRPWRSGVMLGLAASVKIWPLLLFPFLGAYFKNHRKEMLRFFIAAVLLFVLLIAPLFLHGLDAGSSVKNYSQRWENNDAAFQIIHFGWKTVLPLMQVHPGHAQKAARLMVGALVLLIGFILWQKREMEIPEKMLWLIAAVFLLSPTAFPWYAVWIMPLLAICPRKELLLLVVLLPLYYSRYYFESVGRLDIFTGAVVWIEFLPVWILIAWERQTKRKLRKVANHV
ncbi:MAG: hypothetical protein Kow0037_08230 [Calditrichia bacterium]